MKNNYTARCRRRASRRARSKVTGSEQCAKSEKKQIVIPKRVKWLNGIRRQIEDGTELGERFLKLAKSLRALETKELAKNQNLGTRKDFCIFKRRRSVASLEKCMKILSLNSATTTKSESDTSPAVVRVRSFLPKGARRESRMLDLECLFQHADYYFRSRKAESRSAEETNANGSVAVPAEAKKESLMSMFAKMNILNI